MPLTQAQVKEAFDLFDTDASGYITEDEVRMLYKGLNIKVDAEEIIEAGDTDGDKKLSFDEFYKVLSDQQKEAEGPREILAAFEAFNPSGTGEISREDLKEVAASIGEVVTEQDVDEIWQYCADNDLDEQGNSHFSFKAWRSVMEQMYCGRTSRGSDGTYSDENIKEGGLPPSDAEIWEKLAEQEAADRNVRFEQRAVSERKEEARRAKMEAAKEAAQRAKENQETQQRSEMWKVTQQVEDNQREKMQKRKQLLLKQLEQEREEKRKEEEAKRAVLAKLSGRREAFAATAAANEPQEVEGSA